MSSTETDSAALYLSWRSWKVCDLTSLNSTSNKQVLKALCIFCSKTEIEKRENSCTHISLLSSHDKCCTFIHLLIQFVIEPEEMNLEDTEHTPQVVNGTQLGWLRSQQQREIEGAICSIDAAGETYTHTDNSFSSWQCWDLTPKTRAPNLQGQTHRRPSVYHCLS